MGTNGKRERNSCKKITGEREIHRKQERGIERRIWRNGERERERRRNKREKYLKKDRNGTMEQ